MCVCVRVCVCVCVCAERDIHIVSCFFDRILSYFLSHCIDLTPTHERNETTEFNRFKFRVFLLLDWLPYQG